MISGIKFDASYQQGVAAMCYGHLESPGRETDKTNGGCIIIVGQSVSFRSKSAIHYRIFGSLYKCIMMRYP